MTGAEDRRRKTGDAVFFVSWCPLLWAGRFVAKFNGAVSGNRSLRLSPRESQRLSAVLKAGDGRRETEDDRVLCVLVPLWPNFNGAVNGNQ